MPGTNEMLYKTEKLFRLLENTKSSRVNIRSLEEYHRQLKNVVMFARRKNRDDILEKLNTVILPRLAELDLGLLLDEQKKVEEELKDVDYRLTQISDIIKIVEQSESTDQVSIPKDTYDMVISELNNTIQLIDKCVRLMDEEKEKGSSNMQCKKEMKSALDCLYNVIGLL